MTNTIQRALFSWFTFWAVLAGIGLFFVYPLRDSLRLGIDLVGGSYITLEVQTDKAIENDLVALMQTATQMLEKSQIAPTLQAVENNAKEGGDIAMVLTFVDTQQTSAAVLTLRELQKRGFEVSSIGNTVRVKYSTNKEKVARQNAVLQNIEVLRSRVDKLSVSEITIAVQGDKNIVVELPDVSDPQQAKAMIGRSAVLEFKLVEKIGRTEDDILFEMDGDIPGDMMIVPGKDRGTEGPMYYLVSRYAKVTGNMLVDARARIDERFNKWVISFTFNSEGGDKFYDITSKNVNRPLAIILDGQVISAPNIGTALRTSGQIEGNFSGDEAKELATLLKSGSFVAPVTFEEERQIGPSLGEASIKSGLLACLVGLGLILLFSLFYYRVPGLLAFIALLFNLLLVLLGLAWLRATLTLPGIAGMILTVGMAIDASILIFERIKEELSGGSGVREAVKTGFSNAMTVILDANITTLIVGIVLYKFGTGPIQGFAVTMMLGIIATLITGLLFLRSLFTVYLDVCNVRTLKI